jgi:lipoprotein-anchoring transpeptidase ErfK/SrfK
MEQSRSYRSKSWRGMFLAMALILSACSGGTYHPTQAVPPTDTPQPSITTAISPTPQPNLAIPPDVSPAERWIEVSLQEPVVRLHENNSVVAEYLAATGVNDRPEYTTYTGVFEVSRKYRGPVETAPGVFVTDVLEFDIEHGNGIHSLPQDKNGHVLDNRLGQAVTAGCVRVAESAAIFDFAVLGMKVWVH